MASKSDTYHSYPAYNAPPPQPKRELIKEKKQRKTQAQKERSMNRGYASVSQPCLDASYMNSMSIHVHTFFVVLG